MNAAEHINKRERSTEESSESEASAHKRQKQQKASFDFFYNV